jgi:hypothetical protein
VEARRIHGAIKAKHLWVSILKGMAGKHPDCARADVSHKVRTLTITYTDGTTPVSFTIGLEGASGQADLVTDFAGQPDGSVGWWLTLPNPNSSVTLSLTQVAFTTASGTNVSCTLAKGSEVHIYQSNKN